MYAFKKELTYYTYKFYNNVVLYINEKDNTY